MKLGILALGLSILLFLIIPSSVYADNSATVTVIATGYVTVGPGGFVVSYISDWELDLSWTPANGSVGTMVRAAYGHVPTGISDGYLVYNGSAGNFSDTSVSLDGSESVYYRAWSIYPGGSYSSLASSASSEGIMGIGFLFLGWVILAIGLTWVATKVNLILFRVAPFLAWLGLGVLLLLGNITNLGIDKAWTQVLGFVFIVMAFASLLLQIKTETKRNRTVIGPLGRQHTETSTDWSPRRKSKKSSSEDRQSAYRMQIKSRVGRQ
jgi:hypothetical protein